MSMENDNTSIWEWSDLDDCFYCKNCGMSALNDYRGHTTDSQFCPFCGKEMLNSRFRENEKEE